MVFSPTLYNGYFCFTYNVIFSLSLSKSRLCRHYIIIKVSESTKSIEITVGLNTNKKNPYRAIIFLCPFSSCGLLLLFTLMSYHHIIILLSLITLSPYNITNYIQYSNWHKKKRLFLGNSKSFSPHHLSLVFFVSSYILFFPY